MQAINCQDRMHRLPDASDANELSRLYLGDLQAAEDLAFRSKYGITHVLSILHKTDLYSKLNNFQGELRSSKTQNIVSSLRLSVKDEDKSATEIYKQLDMLTAWMRQVLTSNNNTNRLLVHCYGGRSRSPTIVIAYLIRYHKMIREQALSFVQKHRKFVQPKQAFLDLLDQFEWETKHKKS